MNLSSFLEEKREGGGGEGEGGGDATRFELGHHRGQLAHMTDMMDMADKNPHGREGQL